MRKTGVSALQLGGPHPVLLTGVAGQLRPILGGPEAPGSVSGTPSLSLWKETAASEASVGADSSSSY